jgi:hypothetical protein
MAPKIEKRFIRPERGKWVKHQEIAWPSAAVRRLLAAVAALKLALLLFVFLDWHCGLVRGSLLAAGLLALLALLRAPRSQVTLRDAPWLRSASIAVAVGAIAMAGLGILSIVTTHKVGNLGLDQGQNTYRAALHVLRGENPYAAGMLLDPIAYYERLAIREAAGLSPRMPRAEIVDALAQYWGTLDPALRERLLPPPTADADGNANALAEREFAVLGYKYGPLPVMATAALAPLLGRAAVPLLNVICALAWAFVLGLILLRLGMERRLAWLGAGLALLDPHVGITVLYLTALDIWPLLFGALAVLALLAGRPAWLGATLALALGCKLFPALVYLPLLGIARSWRAAVVFAAVSAAIYLPWLAWDPRGLINNFVLWPTLMQPDSSSWVMYVPPSVALALRLGLLGLVIAGSVAMLRAGPERVIWGMAFLNLAVVAAGSAIHNNYLTWFSGWFVLALFVHLIGRKLEEAPGYADRASAGSSVM